MSATFPSKKWALEKFAKWDNNSWQEKTLDDQSSYISVINPSNPLLIIALDDMTAVKIVSIDVSGKTLQVEIHYSEASLSIQTTAKNGNVSKVRVSFANDHGKTGSDNCNEAADELRKFVPSVTEHPPRPHTGENSGDRQKTFRKAFYEYIIRSYRRVAKDQGSTLPTDSYMEKCMDEYILDPQFAERQIRFCEQFGAHVSKEEINDIVSCIAQDMEASRKN